MTDEPKRLTDKFALRLPEGMLAQLSKIAGDNKRSTNAEIIARLEFSFAADVVVQDTGWDVGHGHETPEFKAAYMKSQTKGSGGLDMRVQQEVSKALRSLSEEDIDYLAGRLISRFEKLK